MRCTKGRCPLSKKEENEIHKQLNCKEAKRWRVKSLSSKLLHINEEVIHKKITACIFPVPGYIKN
jgi:hypothetical protein